MPTASWLLPVRYTRVEWFLRCMEQIRVCSVPVGWTVDTVIVIDEVTKEKKKEYENAALSCLDHSALHIVYSNGVGVAGALNTGIPLCGDYIVRIDADDIPTPGRLLYQLPEMFEYKLIVTGGHCNEIGYDGRWKQLRKAVTGNIWACLCEGKCPFIHPTVAIDHRWLDNVGGYPEDYPHCEDLALWFKLGRDGCKISRNLDYCFVNRRFHQNQMSKKHGNRQAESRKRLISEYTIP